MRRSTFRLVLHRLPQSFLKSQGLSDVRPIRWFAGFASVKELCAKRQAVKWAQRGPEIDYPVEKMQKYRLKTWGGEWGSDPQPPDF